MFQAIRRSVFLVCVLTLFGCGGSDEVGSYQAFVGVQEELDRVVAALEGVNSVQSAHLASKEISSIADRIDQHVLNIRPITSMTYDEAERIISTFPESYEAMSRLSTLAQDVRRNPDHWAVLRPSIEELTASMDGYTTVMIAYIEALPTSD